MMRSTSWLLPALLLLAGGCGPKGGIDHILTNNEPSEPGPAVRRPKLILAAPTLVDGHVQGAVAGPLWISFAVENVRLVPGGGAPVDGEGHVVIDANNSRTELTQTSHTVTLHSGHNIIAIELVSNDGNQRLDSTMIYATVP